MKLVRFLFHKLVFPGLCALPIGNSSWAILMSPIFLVSGTRVNWEKSEGLFRVTGRRGEDLWVARRRRLNFYADGLESRLRTLVQEYALGQLSSQNFEWAIDVGANVGEVGMILESRGFRVLAVEPDPAEFRALRRNLTSQSLAVNAALWKEADDLAIAYRNDSGDTTLLIGMAADERESVRAQTLDDVVAASLGEGADIAVMKLEAEGYEPEVLQGAEKTLARTRWLTIDAGPERGPDRQPSLPLVLNQLEQKGFCMESVRLPRLTAQFGKLRHRLK